MRMKRWISILLIILCMGQAAFAAEAEEEFSRPIPAWPVIWHRSDKDLVETDLIFSLIHYEREKNRSAFSFRPYIYWTEKDLDRDYYKVSALFRLFNYEREGTSSSFYIAPLYWTWADATTLHTINLIPPYYHHRKPGEDVMHAWPFYSGISKGNYQEWGGLYPLIRFGRDPVNNVELDQFLLYYRKKEQDRSYTTVFPLYFNREDGSEGSTWLLPIYYSRHDATTTRTVNLIPPYYHSKEPGEETLHIWPFYSDIEKGSYRERGGLYPLIRFGRDPVNNVELDQVLLYYRKKEPDRTYTTFFPLYFRRVEGADRSTWLIPLYFSRSDATTARSINLFPPVYYNREPGEATLHVWPFYSDIEKGSYREWGSLYPLIRFGSDPQNNIELDQFLLYYRKKEPDRSYTTFFPLYFRRVEGAERSTWLIPLYFSRSDATTLHTVNLIPPYYHHREPGEETMHAWPFYSTLQKGSYQEYSVLYPLFRHGRDPDLQYELDYYLLFYRKQEQDRAFTLFFPLYGKEEEGGRHVEWLIPAFYHRHDEASLRTLAPLYYRSREPGQETYYLWPFYRNYAEGSYREYSVLYPLFRYGRDPVNQYELDYYLLFYRKQEQDRSFTTFFPLWYSTSTPELKWRLLLPLYYDRADASSQMAVAPLYYRSKDPGQETLYLWPFYRDHAEGSYREYSFLYPLFRHGRDPELQYEFDYHLLFYRKQEQGRSFTTFFPLWYSSRTPESTWRLFLPLYYDSTTGTEATRFIAPTYYQSASPDGRVYTLFPLFYSRYRPDGRSLYVFPTYYVERTSATKLRTFIPFYVDYKGTESEVLAFVPLYYRRTSAESAFTTVLPLYYDYHRPDLDLTLGVPVYLKYRSGAYTFRTLFPIYYATEDTSLRTSFMYYFPFYGEYRRGDAATRHFLFFPLYDRYEDQEAQLKGWDVLWPLIHYESSPTTRTVRVPPFYWADRSPERSYTVFFPVYWEFVSGESSYEHIIPFYSVHKEGDWQTSRYVFWLLYTDKRDTRTGVWEQDAVFSLYGRRVEADRERLWVFPVYYHRSDPESRLTLALPVLPYYHSVEQDREAQHLIPVYSKMREGSYTEYASFWPLFRHGRDPEKQYELDYYLLYYRKQEQGRTFTTFFPIYGKEKEGDRHVEWLIPAFYHRHEGSSLKTVGLLYYRSREPGQETYYLWPFYRNYAEGSYREYSVLYPLFRYGRDPVNRYELDYYLLFYRKQEQDRTFTTFFPLWYSSQAPESRWSLFLPVYYNQADESSQMALAPLYYSSKDPGQETFYLWPFYRNYTEGSYREYSVLYPLFRYGRDPEKRYELDYYLLFYRKQEQDRTYTLFFPLYGREDDGARHVAWLIPAFYHRHDESSLKTLAPFYYRSREPGQETYYLWPFYRNYAEGSYQEHSVLYPLFRYGRDPEKQYELDYYLLYYRKQEQDRSLTTFFPVWWHKDAGTASTDAIPFLHWYEHDRETGNKDLSLLWIVPPQLSLFRYTREGSTVYHRLFPLYSYTSDEERNVKNWSILWFLFSYESEGEFASQSGFLWKVITYERKDAENYDFRFLWRLIRKSRTPTLSTVEFNPFFYTEEDAEKGSYWAILGGLIGRETFPDGRTRMRFLWVF